MLREDDPPESTAPQARPVRSLPRAARLSLAGIAVALGAAAIGRPTTTLGLLALLVGAGLLLTGVLTLTGSSTAGDRGRRIALATGWLAAGTFVLVFPGLTVRMVAVVVGILLIVHGLADLWSALRGVGTPDARIAQGALGAAGVGLGVLALVWPDITLLVTGVALGARLVILGLMEGWSALRGPRALGPTREPGPLKRWGRTTLAVGALVLALVAGAASVALHRASPVVDDFYAAPRAVPDGPGHLVRSEPFTRGVPATGRAWRILYTTTRGDGSPAVASGLVVVPASGPGGWPVVAWTHGTTGFAQDCAPSLLAEPFTSGALFVLPQVLAQGWALVATDYLGLGTQCPHPYLIGPDSAHAALDAVRAAAGVSGAGLGAQTVVWGHSQGGGAALWTGALAASYAPQLRIDGVAVLAPASNLPGLVGHLPRVNGGSVFASFVFAAYAATYPDVTWRDYVRPGAEATVRAMSQRCLSGPGVLVSVLQVLALRNDPEVFATDPGGGALGARLRQNIPPATITAPLLLAQGGADSLVDRGAQDAFVDGLCDAGQQVDYRVYAGRDHVPLVEPDSPLVTDLFTWTRDRLDGDPATPGCTRSGG